MIDQKRAIPIEHMDYQDLLPKRASLNLVQVPPLVEGNGADARVFHHFWGGWTHTDTTQSENAAKYFFWASFFEKFGPLTALWGKL